MTWQDVVIGTGQFLFVFALVPLIFSNDKPHRLSCALTGITLAAFAVVYATLNLWLGTIAAACCALCWFVLLWQQRPQRSS